ncbi:hypothetical protein CI109_106924 [Kwoniella shandongensis]|uniref:Uncharacterized protein n=1 Tax=Kwoniella shandongensis TaxID=1734106 RepID=A0A5M6C721_9TREE|nr:uncharacterized protein CI109_000821 [Kwoniella shandongensis]KAA5530641.1 hypothetical protein CI109_000821 [Kwoniella shandongensis]
MTTLLPENSKRKFHPVHRDPQHDFIIKSNENVYFRASRFHLARVSTFFADMFNTGTKNRLDDVFTLDYPTRVIDLFLDLVYASTPSVPKIDDVTIAYSLVDITESTLCSSEIRDVVQIGLLEAARKHPQAALTLASHRKDLLTAKTALSSFSKSFALGKSGNECKEKMDDLYKLLDELDPTYAYELLRHLLVPGQLRPEIGNDPYQCVFFIRSNWTKTAEAFDPDRLTIERRKVVDLKLKEAVGWM